MPRSLTRRDWLAASGGAVFCVSLSGCGTILHPERRGQPAGPLDWKIVALDGIGLLLFFVPGVIAFAVDFSNGTIYLPPDRYGRKPSPAENAPLTTVALEAGKPAQQQIELAVSSHVGHHVSLKSGEYETRPLKRLEDFWSVAASTSGPN